MNFLRTIKDNSEAIPHGYSAIELLPELIAGLGSPEQEVRDSLCLQILSSWIKDGYFTHHQLLGIAEHMIANLRIGIREEQGERVLLRSFSVLILSSILRHDVIECFLSATDLQRIMDAAIGYLHDERDWRGFIPGQGWSDALNHTMFIFQRLAAHPNMGIAELCRILDVITDRLIAPAPGRFITTEGFQMAEVVITVLRRELLELEDMKKWLQTLEGTQLCASFVKGEHQDRYHNARDFLMTLHLLLQHRELPLSYKLLLPDVFISLQSYVKWVL